MEKALVFRSSGLYISHQPQTIPFNHVIVLNLCIVTMMLLMADCLASNGIQINADHILD